ncbi:hypothetical protein PF003_g5136 [Phytophthora fragariae]|nr:hypothetical protein PF003_g5136 [Phytophthora fragariae]
MALTERPLLAYPDFSRPFRLVTDAPQVGLGAALTQDQGRGEQPIAYASKINSPTVAKYSITELECAAVVWAVKLFRPYLYGRKFVLMTDHAALKWLMTSKELAGRLHRWALQLQVYDFEVVYRPGSSNVVADALSRAPARVVTAASQDNETRQDGVREGEGSDGQLTDQAIKAEQAQDRTAQNLVLKGKYGGRKIVVENEVVHIVENDGSKRVVLPTALRENHDSIYACHLRTPQTYARVARNYWWPDMRAHVRKWVQACRDCGTRKAKAKEAIPPLRSQSVGSPGDRWALDVAGPLPVTAGENRRSRSGRQRDQLHGGGGSPAPHGARHRAVHHREVGPRVRTNARVGAGRSTGAERQGGGGTDGPASDQADLARAVQARVTRVGGTVSPELEGHGGHLRSGGAE